MRKPKVFIPNVPTRYDALLQKDVPSLDMNAVTDYGEPVRMTEGSIDRYNLIPQLGVARDLMSREFGREDYVVCVGDIVIAAAVIASAQIKNGRVKLLRWDRNRKGYDVVEVRL